MQSTDSLTAAPQITSTDTPQETQEENRYAELICKYVDLIQRKFEEKRLCSAEPNSEYASLADKKKISVYWHTTNKKVTVSFAPKPDVKPKWITEIHLGDEQKIPTENDFFIFRRPIIDVTITSQHSEETEILRTLKGAYEIALSRIKVNNLISPPKNLPLTLEPEEKETENVQTESNAHETGNDHTDNQTESLSVTEQTEEQHETGTDHEDLPSWKQRVRHFWNVFKTTSCFKSCFGHEKED